MNEVIITYLQLPITVNGLVTPTPDGDYQVILNSRLSPEAQRRAYCHELRHILQNHFSADALPVPALEAAATTAAALEDTLQAHIQRAEEHGLPSRVVFAPGMGADVFAGAKAIPGGTAAPAPMPAAPCAVLPGLGPGCTKYAPALLRAVRAQLTGLQY